MDLETIPDLEKVMEVYPQLSNYPGLTLKADITTIICFGYRIVGEKETKCICAWDFPEWSVNVNDDKPLLKAAYEIIKDADCIVTHNGKRFDEKFFKTRLEINKLPPLPLGMKHIDTCQISKKHLLTFNNKLDTLAKLFTKERKMQNGGWDLWVRVRKREPKALITMKKYCIQDVVVLSKIFKRLIHYTKVMPNHNLFSAGTRPLCPNCGSTRIVARGYSLTRTKTYHRMQCKDCFSWSQAAAAGRLPR